MFVLPDPQFGLWDAYQRAENRATRQQKLAALDGFIDSLGLLAQGQRRQWAFSLAEQIVDGAADIVLRQPLFERILFPALLDGLNEKQPGCARWLAGLSQHLYRCRTCMNELGETRS